MNKSERIILGRCIQRLKAKNPRTKDNILAHLNDPELSTWLDLYIISPLECLLPDDRDLAHALEITK